MTLPAIAVERVAETRWRPLDELVKLPFSSVCSDHMLVCEFRENMWASATVRAYGPLPLPPSISALQYGVSVFEGLKAHHTPAGDIVMFRPYENARRLNRSAARLAMPEVPESLFLNGLRTLLRLDEKWVPTHGQGALYIRPCLFSTDESVRVKPAERYLLIAFTFPFGNYYAAPVDVLVTDKYVRAFPGGTGDIKPAGNYAPALLADRDAQQTGCQTVLWLDGIERKYVEECGVMNVFFVLKDGRVITPSLTGTILPGVTRDSVLTLVRDMGLPVEERRISLDELFNASERGDLVECFGTGTAATLSHVRSIRFGDRVVNLPEVAQRRVGPAVRERLVRIATGALPDPYGWLDLIATRQANASV